MKLTWPQSAQVTRLAFPWYNNFLYKIELAGPAVPASFKSQPGTTPPPPDGASTLVLRFSNPHARGINNTNRVQNIVAAQHLARQALSASGLQAVVPAVYAWAPYRPEVQGADGLGWILDEFRPGEDMNKVFPDFSLQEKQAILPQIAEIFTAIQGLELPPGVTKFGALTFDDGGNVVDGQMPTLAGGPWETYDEVWLAKLRTALEGSDKGGTVMLGWRPNGVRDRIERFLADGGVEKVLEGVDVDKRVLAHGDFSKSSSFRSACHYSGCL